MELSFHIDWAGVRQFLVLIVIIAVTIVLAFSVMAEPVVGIGSDIGPEQRHGVLWIPKKEGGLGAVPFTVDAPQALARHSARRVRDLVEQVRQMGYEPHHVELTVGGITSRFRTTGSFPELTYRC